MKLFFQVFVCLSLVFPCLLVNAQISNKLPIKADSIKETIIYEYDTLYVAPDTIRLTDTIFKYQQIVNQTNKTKELRLFNKLNLFSNFSDKWSAGVGIYSYITGIKENKVDSFSIKQTLNFDFELHINYQPNKMRYTLGVGYSQLHEQMQYIGSSGSINKIVSNGISDSLLVNKNCTSDNYYNYLQLFFNIGRKWGNKKVFFLLDTRIAGHFLIKYSAILPGLEQTKLTSSNVDKLCIKVGLYPTIGYILSDNFSISLVPFCSYSPFNLNKCPQGEKVILGLGLRIQ